MATKKLKIAEAIADAASDKAKAEKAKQTKTTLDKVFKRMSVGSSSNVTEAIPTSLEVLDKWVFGCGGWPVKRVSEIFSAPSGGKTSLTFAALAQAQRLGGIAVLIEAEEALQIARATVFGCDIEQIYLSECDSIEEVLGAFRAGLDAIPDGQGPNLMALDSLAMSQLGDVGEKGMEAKSVGKKANIMSQYFPPIVHKAVDKRCAILIVNQIRTKIGVMFGDPSTTPGGDTHKFACSVRGHLWPGSKVKVADIPVGFDTTLTCDKNKLAIPHRKAKLRLNWEHGWDDRWTTINFAKDRKVIQATKETAKVTDETWQAARVALGWAEPTPETMATLERIGLKPGQKAVEEEPESFMGFSTEID